MKGLLVFRSSRVGFPETRSGPIMAIDAPRAAPHPRPRLLGNCGTPEALGPNYVCAACFGPLEVAYDL